MDSNRFRWHAGVLFGFLIAGSFAFPYTLMAIVGAVCGNTGGGCGGALATVLGLTLKPILVSVPLVGLAIACLRRCIWLELGWGWRIAGFLWPLTAGGFFFLAGNFWGVAFVTGAISMPFPVFALFALVFIVFLCFDMIPSGFGNYTLDRLAWIVAGVAAAHAIAMRPVELVTSPLQ
jgi:hypothetical protein